MANARRPTSLADPALWEQFLTEFRLVLTHWQLSNNDSSTFSGCLVFVDGLHQHGLEVYFRQRKSWHISLGAVTWFEVGERRDKWRVSPRSLGEENSHTWYLSDAAQIPSILQAMQRDITALYEPFWQATASHTKAVRWVMDYDLHPEVRLFTAHHYGAWHKARSLLRHLPEQERQALIPEFEKAAIKAGVRWLNP